MPLQRTLLLLLSLYCFGLQAQSIDKFVGKYSSSDHETMAELYLLSDQSFCFTFMGGSLDYQFPGNWKVIDDQESIIELSQASRADMLHQARAQYSQRVDNKISVVIHGYSLDQIDTAVFAFSKDSNPPETFRRLLPQHNNIGRANYALPLISPEDAKYFYLGSIQTNAKSTVNELLINQFEIGQYDTFQLAISKPQTLISETFAAQLVGDDLHLNGQHFSSRSRLNDDTAREVKLHCINPNDKPNNVQTNSAWTFLKPKSMFTLSELAVLDQPLFSENDPESARLNNSKQALVTYEKRLLEDAYQVAKKEPSAINQFLVLSQQLIEIDQRRDSYAEELGMKMSQLLVDTIVQQDFQNAQTIFNTYTDHIFDHVKDMDNRQVQYTRLVMASQGLIIYSVGKDETILSAVLDTLLGQEFDLASSQNPTLVYNLACVHSLERNKAKMLEAIRTARVMGKETKQFLNDSDFEFYRDDADFLLAIQ